MNGRRARYAKDKRPAGSFVALPHSVIRSAQFASLSPHAVKLLLELLAQYNGQNNGDLCATLKMMRARGLRSSDTLSKKLHELEDAGWIQRTRQGGMHYPTLYGITIYALDPSPKLEVTERSFDRGRWARVYPKTGNAPSDGPIRRASPTPSGGLIQGETLRVADQFPSSDARNAPPDGSKSTIPEPETLRQTDSSTEVPSVSPVSGDTSSPFVSAKMVALAEVSTAARTTGLEFEAAKLRYQTRYGACAAKKRVHVKASK